MSKEYKQMTIDDYLNNGDSVQMMNTTPVETVDKVDVETVDYNSLSKEELINTLELKDQAVKNYEHQVVDMEQKHKTEIQNMDEFYTKKINEIHSLVKYYERKLNILKAIITIETGGEK
jgi:hypothetical protein